MTALTDLFRPKPAANAAAAGDSLPEDPAMAEPASGGEAEITALPSREVAERHLTLLDEAETILAQATAAGTDGKSYGELECMLAAISACRRIVRRFS